MLSRSLTTKIAFVLGNNMYCKDLKTGEEKQITIDGKSNEIICWFHFSLVNIDRIAQCLKGVKTNSDWKYNI